MPSLEERIEKATQANPDDVETSMLAVIDIHTDAKSEKPESELGKVVKRARAKGDLPFNTRATIEITEDDPRYAIIFAMSNGSRPEFPQGNKVSMHPRDVLWVADRKNGEVFLAVVRDLSANTVIRLNRFEMYACCAFANLEDTVAVGTVALAFDAIRAQFQNAARIAKEATSDDLEDISALKAKAKVKTFLYPTALLWETAQSIQKLAEESKIKLASVFNIVEHGTSKPKIPLSSPPPTPKGKGKGKSRSPAASSSAMTDDDALRDLSPVVMSVQAVKDQLYDAFKAHLVPPKGEMPKGHFEKEPTRKQLDTAVLHPNNCLLTLEQRILSAALMSKQPIRDVPKDELTKTEKSIKQIAAQLKATESYARKQLENDDKPERKARFNVIFGVKGPHWNGDKNVSLGEITELDMYIYSLLLGTRVVDAAVDLSLNTALSYYQRNADEIVRKTNEARENEIRELRKQLDRTNEAAQQQLQDMTEQMAVLQAENDELKGISSTDISNKKRKMK